METRDGLQIRELPLEVRAETTEDGRMVGRGRAIPYGVETVLWSDGDYEEREIINAGAFTDSLEEIDQRALWNHMRDVVLGRRSAKTLVLTEGEAGVDFEIVFPESPEGQSKFVNVQRGDVNAMSFAWRDQELKEEFFRLENKRIYKRTVIRGALMEISPVTWEAYAGATSIEARDNQGISRTKEIIDSKLAETSAEFDAAAAAEREAELRGIQLESIGG